VFLKCGEHKPSGFFADLRNKTAGIAALFQGCSDKKAVKKAPDQRRRAFRNTLLRKLTFPRKFSQKPVNLI